MKKKFLDSSMMFITKNREYTQDEIDIMRYGLETLYLTITKMLVIFLVAYLLEIFKEFLIIAGWVVLWDMLESVIFTDNKRKIERLNKLQLYDSQVEFVFDTNK